jgi:DNA-binding CsgD family transcriptional regulator
MQLLGRRGECEFLDALLADARGGRSRAVVLRGESGAGKSALLKYVVERADGWRVATGTGVESETELAFGGLHQFCAPMLDRLELLPGPQRDALETVFGLRAGKTPNRFLVGLATLTLLAEAAEEQPLLCVVDDAHWLDTASAQMLLFVGRRLLAEHIALVCAARTGAGDHVFAGLPEMSVDGLRDRDARSLLLSRVPGPIDAAVCQRIITESRGNPLALMELARMSTGAAFAGGFGTPAGDSVARKIAHVYGTRLDALPADTRLLVVMAAAEPLGDRALLDRAAEVLGIEMAHLLPAVDAGLVRLESRVEFTHPLARSVAYQSADADDRYLVHAALAEATDDQRDPDRRAWHRARATAAPDEEIASELEQSAERAQTRAGAGAAAAFLRRALELTAEPGRRAHRALAAADACFQAGDFESAQRVLTTAESHGLGEFLAARASLLRGQLALVLDYGGNAAHLLLQAARELEPFDMELARGAYLRAYGSAFFAAHLGQPGGMLEICRAVVDLPQPRGVPLAKDLLLEGVARLHTNGFGEALPILREAAGALSRMPDEDVLRWGLQASMASTIIWDSDAKSAICERQLDVVRSAGALAELPAFLQTLALDKAANGDLTAARILIAESHNVAAATGSGLPAFADLRLFALQGRQADASALIAATIERAAELGQGFAVSNAHWAACVLYNGLARYQDAAAAAREVTSKDVHLYPAIWALPELVEAASRLGEMDMAREAVDRLEEITQLAGTDWALGIQARSRALVSEGTAADGLYQAAIERFARTRLRPELARAHLLYGEWLRRESQGAAAREQLRTAHEMFDGMGMEAFADRARRELARTGEKVDRRSPEVHNELTAQEQQIAELARDGNSNREIAASLYLSSRTVEWHLRKVFAKLGIKSRHQLPTVLGDQQLRHPDAADDQRSRSASPTG